MEKSSIPIRKRILFAKFDEYVNMTPSEMASFWQSEEANKVSQTPEQAFRTGGLAGKAVTKQVARLISKAAKYRGQLKVLPPWTEDEWRLCGSIVRVIVRQFYNIGDFKDELGNETPKSLALKYWGFNSNKRKTKLPMKQEIKDKVVDYVKKEKDSNKNLKESFDDLFFLELLDL